MILHNTFDFSLVFTQNVKFKFIKYITSLKIINIVFYCVHMITAGRGTIAKRVMMILRTRPSSRSVNVKTVSISFLI